MQYHNNSLWYVYYMYYFLTYVIIISILSKMHDRAVVIWGVQVACFELFEIPQPVFI